MVSLTPDPLLFLHHFLGLYLLFVALSAVVLALALAACSEDEPAPASPAASTQSEPTVAAPPAPAAPPAGNDQVTSEIKSFALEDLTVPVGTTVKWVNKDPEQHTSSSGTPEKPTTTWDSGLMDTDGTFTFTFNREGTFTYFCIVHPDDMRATITVGKPPAAAPQPAPEPTPEREPAPAASPVDQVTASIANFALPNITVAVGATVKWVNDDAFPHTSSSGVPGAATDVWDSGRLGSGDPFTFTFSEEGTFPYFCKFHPDRMRATVTVGEPGPAAAAAPTPEPTATRIVPTETPAPTATTVPPTQTPAPTAAAVQTPEAPTATPVPPTPVPPTPTTVPPTATATAVPAAPTVQLDIANFAHKDATVAVGTKIVWTNRDNAAHTTTSGEPNATTGEWDSGSIGRGVAHSFTFTNVGAFAYFCTIHPSMQGTITVTEQ